MLQMNILRGGLINYDIEKFMLPSQLSFFNFFLKRIGRGDIEGENLIEKYRLLQIRDVEIIKNSGFEFKNFCIFSDKSFKIDLKDKIKLNFQDEE